MSFYSIEEYGRNERQGIRILVNAAHAQALVRTPAPAPMSTSGWLIIAVAQVKGKAFVRSALAHAQVRLHYCCCSTRLLLLPLPSSVC
jgi:hypothetical protein